MGIFSRITKGKASTEVDKNPERQLEALARDQRLHARYMINDEGLVRIHLSGLVGEVKDVSYGGLAVRFDGEALPKTLPPPLTGRLQLLDRSVDCKLATIRIATPSPRTLFAGLALLHETPDTLLFLREFIEPMRCGKSLLALGPEMRHERYQGKEWTYLRGDGPTDIILKTSTENQTIEEALLTFRNGNTYYDLSLKGGHLRTSHTTDKNDAPGAIDVAARMTVPTEIDKTTLRHAVYILMSTPPAYRKATQPLLNHILAALQIAAKSKDAA